ncbi:MAG TPA: hypothetical protein VF630_09050 [Hymenobacter sp.]|jgi:hypothetical protein
MLPTLLPLDAARLLVHKHVLQLNAQQPTRTFTRLTQDRVLKNGTVKPGGVVVITRRAKAVNDGCFNTCLLLLQRARKQADRMLANPMLWDALSGDEVPPIEVNGRELMEKRGMSDRSMRNHIAQGLKVGIFVRKKFRGTRASFHVWINPDLVWEKPQKAVETPAEADSETRHISSFFNPNGKNFPHTEVLETLDTPEIKITSGEKLVAQPAAAGKTGNPFQETEARSRVDAGKRAKKGAAGPAARPVATGTPSAAETALLLAQAQKMAFVQAFWNYAKEMIYPGRRWGEEQERKILNAIWCGVYGRFRDFERYDWEAFQRTLLRRLRMVRDHLQLHPDCYLPLPYADHKPGTGYFDAENERGFRGTYRWLQNEAKQRRSTALEQALRAALTELGQRRALDKTPGVRLKASEKVRTRSLLQLYMDHHRTLKRLGGAEGLYRYNAELAVAFPDLIAFTHSSFSAQ